MAQVLLACPNVAMVRLTEALRRLLLRRGHRVRVVTQNPVVERCASRQLAELELIRPGSRTSGEGLDALAVRAMRIRGVATPGDHARARERRRLERYVSPFNRLLDVELPEVVVLCGDRSASARLLTRMAKDRHTALLHLGEGLIPGTVQCDTDGLDGDASACRRTAAFYRTQPRDPELLQSALVHALATGKHGTERRLVAPSVRERLDLRIRLSLRPGERFDEQAFRRWQRLARRNVDENWEPLGVPTQPHVVLLRQRLDDPRVRIDAPFLSVDDPELVRQSDRAVRAVDPHLRLVVVDPPADHPQSTPVLQTVLTAAAVITVNHPGATTALLAGTPVVHLGRAPWAVRSICERAVEPQELTNALQRALQPTSSNLRQRMLAHLLRVDHFWCDPIEPLPRGVSGIVREIERVADRTRPDPVPLEDYEPGPSGPLRFGAD